MIKSIAFTCYPTQDMARAREFYEQVLGLTPATNFEGRFQEYELEQGVFTLGLVRPEDKMPEFFSTKGTSIAFEVDDLDGFVATLKAKNVPFEMEPMDTPVCRMCFISDPDGNVVGLHQLKK